MSPVPLEALEGLTGRLLSLGLVHAVWIGLLAAAVAAIVFQALPRLSHRVRHGLLAMAMGAVVIGPVVAVMIQRSTVEPRSLAREVLIPVATTRQPTESKPLAEPRAQPAGRMPMDSIAASIRFNQVLTAAINRLEAFQPALLAAWSVGVVILSARLILGAISLRRLVHSTTRLDPIQARADALARRLRLRRMPPVLVHPGPIEPGLCGLFRPMILLPGPWLAEADAGRIDAILAHELAHARRYDLPANLLQRLVETALFFHPAVHWLSRTLRRERELCADALAVALTGDPISLASALESVARFRLTSLSSSRRAPLFGASLGGENLSLLPRIQELLGMMPNTPARRSLRPWVSLPAAGLFALLGASLSLAQDPPKASELPVPSTGIESSFVTVFSTGMDSGGPKPAQNGSKPGTDEQISLAVRLLSVEDPAWRGLLQGGMREVHQDHAVTAWIVQDKAVQDFLTWSQQHPTSNVRFSPKVTTLDGARATITFPAKNPIVDVIQKSGVTNIRRLHHDTKPIELVSQVDLVGRIRPGSVMLIVDHFRTTLMPMLEGAALAGGESSGTSAPGLWTKHIRVEQDVPENTGLLIRLGHEAVRREKPEVVGGPSVEADLINRENLVLITPVTIRLEPEERPAVSTSDTKPHPKPSRTTHL